MHTVEIAGRINVLEFPSSLDELSPENFIAFVNAYIKFSAREISYRDFKIMMLFHFIDIDTRNWVRDKLTEVQKDLITENVHRLSELINFFFSADKTNGEINLAIDFSSWTKNLLPEYKGYHGPVGLFSDLIGIEYKEAQVESSLFMQDLDTRHLDVLCAVLYRKPLLPFMQKPKFDAIKVAAISKKTCKWPLVVKYGVFLNFMALQYHLKCSAFTVDGKEISFAPLFSEENSGSDDNLGMTALFFTLAESRVFGNVAETSSQNIFDILYRLYQIHTSYNKNKKTDG